MSLPPNCGWRSAHVYPMKPRKIVVVTDEFDLSADAVILRLREMGHLPVRVNLKDVPLEASFSLLLDGARRTGKLRTKNREIDLSDILSIFWRNPGPNRLPGGFSAEAQKFARAEIDHALNGLWLTLDCYWMSFPNNVREASWKPGQLRRAAELGFEIPRTLITLQPGQVMPFYEQCKGKMIFKVMGDPILEVNDKTAPEGAVPKAKIVHPVLINGEGLKDNLDNIANTPCLFQEYVEKKLELRVTIIGDDIFVAEIDAPLQLLTPFDWRPRDVPMTIKKGSLPAEIEKRCFGLVRGYGLNYSTIDLVLTPDGRYIFLESNPNGHCYHVQTQVPELKMIDAVAACLLRGNVTNNGLPSGNSEVVQYTAPPSGPSVPPTRSGQGDFVAAAQTKSARQGASLIRGSVSDGG
jgi:glutathione synthase/RimK-type ligase-like ATP-grasp enzyme